jgi:hypothetical protein
MRHCSRNWRASPLLREQLQAPAEHVLQFSDRVAPTNCQTSFSFYNILGCMPLGPQILSGGLIRSLITYGCSIPTTGPKIARYMR